MTHASVPVIIEGHPKGAFEDMPGSSMFSNVQCSAVMQLPTNIKFLFDTTDK